MSSFFSIIIPVYNTEKLLPRALDSILNQDFDNNKIEVIVVNDGSPNANECRSIIKEYAKKLNIKFIDNIENQGLYMARKVGIENVSDSEGYLLHLDSDDYFEANALSTLYDDILRKGDADYIEFCFYGLKKNVKIPNFTGVNTEERTLENVLSFKQCHSVCNKCFRKSFIKNIYKNMPNFYSYYNEDYYQMGIIDYYAKKKRVIKSSIYVYVLEIGVTGIKKYKKEELRKVFSSIQIVEKHLCDFYRSKHCEKYIHIVENISQSLYDSCIDLADKSDFFDIYIEILGIQKLKTLIIKRLDELNSTIKAYEKKMKLLLPIKILIKPFRELCKFCKKHSKNKGD